MGAGRAKPSLEGKLTGDHEERGEFLPRARVNTKGAPTISRALGQR